MTEEDISHLRNREITLLMGGWSSEREISLRTGKAVEDSIKSMGLKLRVIDLKSSDEISNVLDSLDLVFLALHGRGGEDGYIQKILERNNVSFTGSNSKSCKISFNKSESKKIWRDLSLPTPDFVEIKKAGTPNSETVPYLSGDEELGTLKESFVVKPAREGSSLGISIVHPGQGSLEDAMRNAIKFDDTLIVEAFIKGEEITVPIIGDKALKPISIKSKNEFYDFDAKYNRTDTEYFETNLNKEELLVVNELSLNAFLSLGCSGWGRVDLILDSKRNFQLLEINTVPGLTETSLVPKAANLEGLSFNNLVLKILNTACFKD
ncbi:MAG: D-alanine--D-alanine ligase [Gammaproteobacteria bacterium]|nr:D-alanine--D-alanine ligase [Gammaproteobacteria bacterium]|tara:strand:+ start:2261 stop:3226 length:966 start_codon:yes stop_codon:yes gene_type:complete